MTDKKAPPPSKPRTPPPKPERPHTPAGERKEIGQDGAIYFTPPPPKPPRPPK